VLARLRLGVAKPQVKHSIVVSDPYRAGGAVRRAGLTDGADLTAGSGIGFEDAGEHELKGVPDRWRVYRVTSTA
jgi:hypothetical protein